MLSMKILAILVFWSFNVPETQSEVHRSFLFLTILKALDLCVQLIPDDMVFQSGDVPSYETSDGSVLFHLLNCLKERKELIS